MCERLRKSLPLKSLKVVGMHSIFRRALVFYLLIDAQLQKSKFLQQVGHLLVFCNKTLRKLRHTIINTT